MKVIHVVPAISDEADGVANMVRNLCESQVAFNLDVRLATLDWSPMTVIPNYLTRFPIGWGPRNLGVSPQMRRWLHAETASGEVDIIHNHGLWMMPNVYSADACIKSNSKLIVSPHGAMSAWALGISPFKKSIFWKLLQSPALRAAQCFHATAEHEFVDIRQLGFKQPVCIIPCGVNMPTLVQDHNVSRRQLLFLGRIHPIKGIDTLLYAWQAVEQKFPDWDLCVVGPDDGCLDDMQALTVQLNLKRVSFMGPLFGDDKLQAYRDASLYVLPSHSENFGITVAEALAAGTPSIVTHGAPWSRLPEHGAGWWIENGVVPLVACLEDALSLSPNHLKKMGKAGHAWMERDFSWKRIAKQFLVTYKWLINGGEPPAWIRLY